MLPLTGRTVGAGGADPRWLHDRLLPAAARHAATAACVRHRRRLHRRHHRRRPRGGREVHRGPAHPRGSRGCGRFPNYQAADPGAQFPAGGPADPASVLPVRAFTRRRRARGGALHRATGRRRGVVLTPEGDWGTRVAAAFDEELRAAGGFRARTGELRHNDAQRFRRQHHAGASHRRQPHAPPAHPGHHRPEARVRTAPAPRHPVHLRAQPARRGASAASAAAFPSRR